MSYLNILHTALGIIHGRFFLAVLGRWSLMGSRRYIGIDIEIHCLISHQ